MYALKRFFLLQLLVFISLAGSAQDVIERSYFPNAQARNAAIAAARYAEEAYYYTRFTTFVNSVDSSRVFADTALFFVKRSLMLCDTSLLHAPVSNTAAIDYLLSGKNRTHTADSIIRGFYPMVELSSHHYFGREAAYHLSNSVMDHFSASLLLKPEDESEGADLEEYAVLPFDDEVLRLEADETAFQYFVNQHEEELQMLGHLKNDLQAELGKADSQKARAQIRSWLDEVDQQMAESTSNLEDASMRIQDIRFLLDKKYLKDLADIEGPEHLAQFETDSPSNDSNVLINEDLPDGLAYKIQLGYYPNDLDINHFKGLYPISRESVKDNLSRFYAGLFFTYSDASKGLQYVRNNAIANSFIVPFLDGKKIGMSRAVEIEKQRGVK